MCIISYGPVHSTSRVIYDTEPGKFLFSAGEPKYGYSYYVDGDDSGFEKVTEHKVTIIGLTPGQTYYYRVVSHASPATVGQEKSFIASANKKIIEEENNEEGSGGGVVSGGNTETGDNEPPAEQENLPEEGNRQEGVYTQGGEEEQQQQQQEDNNQTGFMDGLTAALDFLNFNVSACLTSFPSLVVLLSIGIFALLLALFNFVNRSRDSFFVKAWYTWTLIAIISFILSIIYQQAMVNAWISYLLFFFVSMGAGLDFLKRPRDHGVEKKNLFIINLISFAILLVFQLVSHCLPVLLVIIIGVLDLFIYFKED